jgi:hypothetical protein
MILRAARLAGAWLMIIYAKEPTGEGAKDGPENKKPKGHFACSAKLALYAWACLHSPAATG